ncbi:MAG: tetratricopeptide repeat protein [Bacteroidales bacterium]|nr:tetratricopeptide repeat protein [Bacteroidales bacterium]
MQRFGFYVVISLFIMMGPAIYAQQLTPEQKQEQVFDRALDLFRKEKYASAQQLFDLTASSTQQSLTAADATYYAAVCAEKLDNDDAASRLERFLRLYPRSARCNMARFYLGNFYYARGKFDRALIHYRNVHADEVEYNHRSEYNFKCGYCYLQAEKYKEAKSCFVQQVDGESKYKSASIYYYAHILYTNGDYVNALNYFQKIKDDPKFNKIVLNYEVRLYYYLGRYDEVLNMAPSLISDPEAYKPAEISQMVAEIYYNQGYFAEALPYYRAAMAAEEHGDVVEAGTKTAKSKAPTRATCTPQDNYYQMGYCYYMLQQFDSAAYFLEKKTACIDSVAQSALYTLGDIYLQQNRKEDARTMFLQASKMTFNPDIQEEALFAHAKLSCELGLNPYNESIRSFQNYLKKYPQTKHKSEVQEILASLYLTTSNYKDALTLLEGIPDRSMALNKAYQRILLNYGIELFNKGQIEKASDYFQKAGTVNVDTRVSANAYYLYGEAQYRLGNAKVASKSIDRFLLSSHAKKSPYYCQGLYTMGYICMGEKDYDDAIDYFRTFVEVAPSRGVDAHQVCDAYNRMGDCRYVRRHYNDAISTYDRVVKAGDDDADYATFQQALAYGALGDDQNKFTYLQRLFDRYPKSSLRAKALLEMADTYMKLDNSEMALKKYEEYLRLYPSSSRAKEAMLSIGLIYYNTQRDDKALETFDRLLKKYPETDESRYAINTIKSIYVEQNRVDEYFTYIRKNTKISISDLEQDSTIYLAAEDRYISGEYAQAAVALDNYLKRYPNGLFSQKASYYAADSYQRTMHPDKALPHYLAVIATPRSRYTEDALLNAAGISYDQKNFVLADSLYRMLAQQAEADGNRIIGKLGVLRCALQLNNVDEVDNAASDLLSESRITAEHRDEALISKARMSYNAQMHQTALERYAMLLNSANGEYSGEAAYRRAEIYYITEQVSLAEKEINNYVGVSSSDYWLAKTFILWADIYYNVYHNNLQAKQTLQSIIDNYDGEELVDIALKKRNEIIESEAAEQKPEEPEMIIDINE